MTGLRDVKLHLIESIDDVLRYKEWLGQRRPRHALAVDTETTGLMVGSDIVRLVQVGDGEHGWAMPWTNERGLQGRFIGGWAGLFADTMSIWDGDIYMHNAKFDYGMLAHMGVRVSRRRVKDTRLMAHCVAPNMSTALKNVAKRTIDASSSQAQEILERSLSTGNNEGGWTWGTIPIDYQDYWTYAALDPVLTYRVADYLLDIVEVDCPVAFELENDVQWVIERMERYGARIDVDLAKTKYASFMQYVNDVEKWVWEHYQVKPGSNAAIVRILQEMGYEFTKETASGAVALDKEVLGGIDHPLAVNVLARRQVQKLASTYLRHFIDDVDENDRLHPSINTVGARTSRMSMSDPNLQNLPRHSEGDKAANAVRECVIASEGHTLLMCDFDQVEMRGLAHMAQEESMIAAFKDTSRDFFVSLAQLVYGDATIVKSSPLRQIVKNAGYATIYGAGVEKFAKTAGIPLEQAYKVRARWDELFPKVAKFQRDVIETATRRRIDEGAPYVRCPITGRRQVSDAGKEYSLVNFLIQGASAAIFKQKLLQLASAGLDEWMVVPVHDEIILDVPNEHVPDVIRTLEAVMNDDTILSVPLTASVSHGQSWGAKTSDPFDEHHIRTDLAYGDRGGHGGQNWKR